MGVGTRAPADPVHRRCVVSHLPQSCRQSAQLGPERHRMAEKGEMREGPSSLTHALSAYDDADVALVVEHLIGALQRRRPFPGSAGGYVEQDPRGDVRVPSSCASLRVDVARHGVPCHRSHVRGREVVPCCGEPELDPVLGYELEWPQPCERVARNPAGEVEDDYAALLVVVDGVVCYRAGDPVGEVDPPAVR